MVITSLEPSDIAVFAPLAPAYLLAGVDGQSRYGLAAIGDEEEEHPYCAGVLLFDAASGSNGELDTVVADLKWLYVSREHRREGAGSALLLAMLGLVARAGVEAVICDLPYSEEYDELGVFLEQTGDFLFQTQNSYEMELELKELTSMPMLQKPASSLVHPLRELGAVQFRGILAALDQMEGISTELPFHQESYDQDVSCVLMEDGTPVGALLIRQLGEDLELMALRTLKNHPAIPLHLLLYAVAAGAKKYSPDTVIHLTCRTPASGALLDGLFPGHQPPLIRRGFLVLREEEAEENG